MPSTKPKQLKFRTNAAAESATSLLLHNQKIAQDLLVQNQKDAVELLVRDQKMAEKLLLTNTGVKRTRAAGRAAKLLRKNQESSARLLAKQQKSAMNMLKKTQMTVAELMMQSLVIVENSQDAIIGTTLDGVITSWNGGAVKIFGYSPEEVIGKSGSLLFPPEMWSKVPALLKKIRAKQLVADYDIGGLRKDGTRIDLAISITPVLLQDGTVIGASVVERDITARKVAEDRTATSLIEATKLSQVIESGSEAVLITDKEGMITYVNPAWERTTGWKSNEVVGKLTPRILKSGKQDAKFYENLWQTITRGERFRAELVNKRKNGTEFDAEALIMPIKLPTGEIIFADISRDISERKKDEALIKEGDVLKNKFIQIVSHQFRTPLNAIRWNLETLLAADLGPMKTEQKQFIRMTLDADLQLIERVGDLLTAMDIEEKRTFLELSEIQLDSMLASVVGGFRHRCDFRRLTCTYVPPATQLPLVSADAEKMRRVFMKLMLNAIDYTPKGGKIDISIAKTASGIRFEIKDSGIGIPTVEQSRVFNRFYRASNASVMLPDASGLGLYIAKYFVEQHGGKIGFESKEGKGSTFWFELPTK